MRECNLFSRTPLIREYFEHHFVVYSSDQFDIAFLYRLITPYPLSFNLSKPEPHRAVQKGAVKARAR